MFQFRMNEFGMMEMVDDEQFGKRKRKLEIDNLTSIKEDVEEIIVNGCDEVEEIEKVKKRKLKEDKIENEKSGEEKEEIHEGEYFLSKSEFSVYIKHIFKNKNVIKVEPYCLNFKFFFSQSK